MISLDTSSAFEFYQSIAHRLPNPGQRDDSGASSRHAPDLLAIADQFDVFVFDAFGVLNIGAAVVPGAAACIEQLRAMEKRVFVLTNGASRSLHAIAGKFHHLGFDFTPTEVVSSRHAAEQAIELPGTHWSSNTRWGAITGGMSRPADLQVDAIELEDEQRDYDRVDAFLFLSTAEWNDRRQALLAESLRRQPRPMVVANPDVVAPLVSGYSLEPGYFAHLILDEFEQSGTNLPVEFHGKPFPSVYANVIERMDRQVPGHRIAMLGDTLHTDVLGAKAQGWSSVLVSSHGLFRGFDVQPFIEKSGLVPDWIIPSI